MNMSNPRSCRKSSVEDKSTTKKEKKSACRASSFHVQESTYIMPRPRTVPNLTALLGTVTFRGTLSDVQEPKKLPKMLLNVTIQRSLGPVQVVMLPDSTVSELIAVVVRLYLKEGRRPILHSADPACFDLHYSQFSLESLNREENLLTLGSRNFFLCPKEAKPMVLKPQAAPDKLGRQQSLPCLRSYSWI